MSNVLNEDRKQQVIALGRLGWSLRRIQRETGVRRETAAGYLKAVGITVRPPAVRGRAAPQLAKPASPAEVTTDSGAAKPATTPKVTTDSALSEPATAAEVTTDSAAPKPANGAEVTTDFGWGNAPAPASIPVPVSGRSPTASVCEPYRDAIELWLSWGRNAMAIWRDLVSDHGFTGAYQSVKRFVRKLRGSHSPEARVVITTAPGEDYGKSRVMVRGKRQPVWFRANHRDSSNSRFP